MDPVKLSEALIAIAHIANHYESAWDLIELMVDIAKECKLSILPKN
jgi:hypothetical protein